MATEKTPAKKTAAKKSAAPKASARKSAARKSTVKKREPEYTRGATSIVFGGRPIEVAWAFPVG